MRRALLVALALVTPAACSDDTDKKPQDVSPLTLPPVDRTFPSTTEQQLSVSDVVRRFCDALTAGDTTALTALAEELASASLSPADVDELTRCTQNFTVPSTPGAP